ncbi:peptidase inhibitor family I36 protein [Streptomyces parvus]|uniref:peptidase inhibitor family I36 protein n=1 Tax=Streptomyces parvus TaxID=66428 RepID=UPI00363D7BFC
MKVNRKSFALVGAATAAVLGTLIPTAGAAPAPAGVKPASSTAAIACPDGYFCVYSGVNQTGRLLRAFEGDWTGNLQGVRSYFNNGRPHPGFDHVALSWVGGGLRCIHYWDGAGSGTPYKGNFPSPKKITKVKWRGEC